MNRAEAQAFFRAYSELLADKWNLSPEGREYKKQFDEAIQAIVETAQPSVDIHDWERDCTNLLRCHEQNKSYLRTTNFYIDAIKMTRNKFSCSLVDAKRRVDALREKLAGKEAA